GFARGLHDAVLGAFDRVGRTHLGARRRVAVHTHDGHGLRAAFAVDEVELDHRLALVRVALGAGLDARLAADAPGGIDEEFEIGGYRHGAGGGLLLGFEHAGV